MTYELPHLLLAFVGGVAIGIFYFGGLWWTVERLPRAQKPALLATVSFLGRTFVSIFAFFLMMAGSWQRLLVSVLGFLVVRTFMVYRRRPERTASEVRKGVRTCS
jgi:F1F0 ATPase subunit 2